MKLKRFVYSIFCIITLAGCSSNPAEYIAGVFSSGQEVVDSSKTPDTTAKPDKVITEQESILDKIVFWESSNSKSKASNLNIDNIWSLDIGKDRDASSGVLQPSFDGEYTIYTIDTAGLVSAVDINSGDILWNFKLNLDVTSGLYFYRGHIYFGTSDGKIYGYEVSQLKQNTSILSSLNFVGLIDDVEVMPTLSIQLQSEVASPAIGIDDLIYIKQGDGDTVAINIVSKKIEWVHQGVNVPLSLKGSAAITRDLSNIYVARDDGNFVSLTSDTGKLNWLISISPRSGRNELESLRDIEMSPIIKDGIAYVGSFQGSLVSVDVITGDIIWRRSVSIHSNSSIDDYVIYISSSKGDIVAYDRFSGDIVWSTVVDEDILFSQPVPTDEHILSFGTNGYVALLNKDDGTLIHYNKLLGPIDYQSNVLTVNKTIYIVTKDGRLNAIKLN